MAQRALSQEALTCPICLEILTDPVTLHCGHSYCMDCIETNWNREVRYSCPQCRECFTPRPVLVKSTVLANLVEELKTIGLIAPPADRCYADPGDVSCDVCTGRKLKAVNSCLQCLVSYCETHLQPHRDVAVLQGHQLVAPSDKLQENLCSEHNLVKNLFCRTDQQIICSLCSVEKHRGHDTVSSAAERDQRHKQLEAKKTLLQQNLQDKETEQERLQQEAQNISRSAQTAVQQSEERFRDMVLLLEKQRSEVELQIRSEEMIQLKQVQKRQDQLQGDINDLERSISELDTLSRTPDHNQVILLCHSLSADTEKTEAKVQIDKRGGFEDLARAVSTLRDKLQLALSEFHQPKSEPSTREDFMRFACDITLDPNTAHKCLSLSNENRKATFMNKEQSYPDNLDRFVSWFGVLSREGLTGRCYWEVEWHELCGLRIAVSYRNIERQGAYPALGFGNDDKSWALRFEKNSCCFLFNGIKSKVSGPISHRIGIYLDHSAGSLSFYSVKDQTMNLLHRVQTTFTQPLFAGVWLGNNGDTAHFLKLK